ncbi:MAG: cyanophycin synthetase [Candidatus Saliniplasma sp.]
MSNEDVRIIKKNYLKGPNIHALFPVLDATLDLGDMTDVPSDERIKELLVNFFPEIKNHTCSPGYKGGFLERLDEGTYPTHVIEHIAIAIQNMAGDEIFFGKSRKDSGSVYNLIIEYNYEELVDHALDKAVEIYNLILRGEEDLEGKVNSIIKKARKVYLLSKKGPSTKAILDAAKRHDIPFRHIHRDYSLYSLGWGVKKKRIWGPVTSKTSMISSDIAQDKLLTKKVLHETGFSVPEGETVTSKEEAIQAAKTLRYPVIIKPVDGHQGKGVIGDIIDEDELEEAYDISKQHSDKLLLEEHIPGDDFRFLVIDDEVKAVSKRIPAHVTGDGKSTIEELVEKENEDPRRSEGHQSVLTSIRLGKEEKRYLRTRGFIPESVPDKGEKVYLRVGGNLSTGAISENYTGRVNPELIKIIERASKVIGMDMVGIDIIAEDVTKHPDDMRWGIIEVNASPGLRMHTDPAIGEPIDVGKYVIDHLYPKKDGRIPLIAVTGTNGKTTTVRLIEWIARGVGFKTGMTVTGGIYLDGERIVEGDTTGPWSARVVLDNPDVEYAVLETARGGILRSGLGFDKTKVSVVTNIQKDHLGLDGIETLEDIFHVKSLLLEATQKDGYCVFNGNDGFADGLLERCRGIPFIFAVNKDDKVSSFIEQGIKTLVVEDSSIVLYEDGEGKKLVSISDIPYLMGGVKMWLENTMAAIAASHASGISMKNIIRRLKVFSMDEDMNPGRANTYELDDSLIVLDYAHNIEGIKALGDYSDHLPGSRKIIALTIPGDRSDEFIKQCGKEASDQFDIVICTENEEVIRGREYGETCNLVAQGVLDNDGNVPISISDKDEAIEFVLQNRKPGDRLIFADLDLTSQDILKILSKNGSKGDLRPFNFRKNN